MAISVSIITLGCKVNQYESEQIFELLTKENFVVTEGFVPADIYILNTCSVTGEAQKKSRQSIGKLLKINPTAKIYVCGCASQNVPKDFFKKENITAIMGTYGKQKLINAIKQNLSGDLSLGQENLYENYTVMQTASFNRRYQLKVQDGCNNFCTYCIVPHLRGRSRSRNIADVLTEAKNIPASVKEVVVIGINLSDYKINDKLALGELIFLLKDFSFRTRLGSLEVNVITDKFLETLASVKNFCPHFHLSLQSGSDAVLKSMNRRYKADQFLSAVKLIRKYFPDSAITTDLIVGFPTESDENFVESLKLIQQAKFSDMHIFPYSPREGTPAFKMQHISGTVIKNRLKRAHELSAKNRRDFLQKQINKTAEVLTEDCKNGYTFGYTKNYIRVYIKGKKEKNKIYKIRLKELFNDGMIGEII